MLVRDFIKLLEPFADREIVGGTPFGGGAHHEPSYYSTVLDVEEGYAVHDRNYVEEKPDEVDVYRTMFVNGDCGRSTRRTTDGKPFLDLSSPYIRPAIRINRVERPFADFQAFGERENATNAGGATTRPKDNS